MKIQAKYYFLLLMLSGLIGFQACIEAVDWELQTGNNAQLVIDAILTDQLGVQEIRLSQSYDELNGATPAVTDAIVSVSANGQSARFIADSMEPGLYKSEGPFAVVSNLDYILTIDWQGTQYTASSRLSTVAPIPPIRFLEVDDSLAFAEIAPLYNPNQQAMYKMQVNWSHLSNEDPTQAKLLLYTFSSIDVSQLVRPARDTVLFPRGSVVIAKKFGLNDDFAEYLQALAIETDWRGGAFYGAPTNLPTNISNGALGFFSTCAVKERVVIAR